jgi:hypothetical protein
MKITVYDSPVYHIIIDNIFGETVNKEIFLYILSLKEYFGIARVGKARSVSKNRTNSSFAFRIAYRNPSRTWVVRKKSRATSPLLRVVDNLFESKYMELLMDSTPYPLCKFGQMDTWETHISRYGNNNEFYSWHKDRGENDMRIISMVYYLHSNPRRFKGGELVLTNGLGYRGNLVGSGKTVELEPKNDRMVIFNSRTVHCVKPTRSGIKFEDGRFSVNVWAGFQDRNLL